MRSTPRCDSSAGAAVAPTWPDPWTGSRTGNGWRRGAQGFARGNHGGVLIVPCPVLVGRSAELDVLLAGLDGAATGSGRLVFVAGEAGIGKSRLAQELCARASARGMRVLRGRAVPGASVPFRPLAEALAPVALEVAQVEELRAWLPALSAVLPTVAPAVGAEATAPMRAEATLRVLAAACSTAGGVLLLEDVHWADPESVSVLEHLGDNLERAPVLCIATIRPEENGPAGDLVRRAAARRAPQILELGHLNDAQVAAMVYSCMGGTGTDAVSRVLSLSEGIPFLVEEMLASPGVPASFADGVSARMAELPAAAREVLVSAAAFGREFDWRLLGAATGQPESDVVDALERGVRAQLLTVDGEDFRFRHALSVDAVFQSLIPPRREAAAAAALAALDAALPDVPAELRDAAARLAERAGQSERAGYILLEAGEDALGRGALGTAVDALERACRLLPAGDARDAASEHLVGALVSAGRVDDAFDAGRALVGRLDVPRAAKLHLRLAGAALTASRWELARAELASATDLVGADTRPALRAELHLRQADLAAATDRAVVAGENASAALQLSRQAGLPWVECEALQLLGRLARRSSLHEAERWFREALEVAERHDLPLLRLRCTHELGTIALLDRSEVDLLLEAQALAESMGAMATAAILDIEIAAGYASVHDVDGAERHGRQAVQRATDLSLDLVAAFGWHHVAGAAMLRGDAEGQAAAAGAARAAAPGNRDIEGLLAGLEVFAALLADDIGRALVASERGAEVLRGSVTAPPAHFRPAWPLLLAVRHRPEAPSAVDELEQAGLAAYPACRGTLTMARAVITGWEDPDAAAPLAVEADGELAFVPLWRFVVRRLAADAAAVDGWTIPDGWLAEAERWCRGQGYPALAAACAALGGRPSATVPPGWARLGVTRREADVLSLVIEGRSNREIAERLYLSVRTVEKHVEALLRKTRSKTRTQLARIAATT
jgi:DNA-binding CsgD family transcriptional regulator